MAMTNTAPRENGIRLDQFNDALRESPGWRAFMQRNGIPLDGRPIRLSDQQRNALQSELQRAGVQFPKGMQIDPAGNVNQDQGVSAAWANPWIKWPVLAGGALVTMGALGYGPLAGVLGGGGGAAPLAGIPAGTLPGGAAAPLVTPGLAAGAGGTAVSVGAAAPSVIPGIAAGTLPGGAAAPVGAVGGTWTAPTIPGLAAGTLPGGGRAPVVSPGGVSGGQNVTPGLGGLTDRSLFDDVADRTSWADRFTDPAKLAELATGLAPVVAGLVRGRGNGGGNPSDSAQLNELLGMMTERARRTDPLHQMVTRLAESRMPITARNS